MIIIAEIKKINIFIAKEAVIIIKVCTSQSYCSRQARYVIRINAEETIIFVDAARGEGEILLAILSKDIEIYKTW